jgi:hypothetical protein
MSRVRNNSKRRRQRKAGLSGGALLAGQLAGHLAGAPPAQAVALTVTNTNDAGAGSLRAALATSNASTGVTDTITFSGAGATGTILLTTGQLVISDDVTIIGPGAPTLAVDGNSNGNRVFYVHSLTEDINVTISGLTVTHGDRSSVYGLGGGIGVVDENLILREMTITQNSGAEGGGIHATRARLTIIDCEISDNDTIGDGAGLRSVDTDLTVTGTDFLTNDSGEDGGGVAITSSGSGSSSIHRSIVADNVTDFEGGGIYVSGVARPMTISALELADNSAVRGGGLWVGHEDVGTPDPLVLSDSMVSGNTALFTGGGVFFYGHANDSGRLVVERSTIVGNDGAEGAGMALVNGVPSGSVVTHSVLVTNSTISGNNANELLYLVPARGGGIWADLDGYDGDIMSVVVEHSTIAENSAAGVNGAPVGGGAVNTGTSPVTLDHTIVADNTAPDGTGNDLAGPFSVDWSLIEDPAGASPNPALNANNVTGVDPQLEPLADNVGTTLTHMIPITSPAFNRGDPAFAPPPIFDQRGLARVSGLPGPNRRIDIGAVEVQFQRSALPAVVNQSVNYHLRESLTTGQINLGPYVLGTTPLVPVMGDWDGDGMRTPGYFKGGQFFLSNEIDGSGTIVNFTFGDSRGFPVVGDWDGDKDEEVAVFRAGTWLVRANTSPTSTTVGPFTFGSGTWPLTVPVAGDWNGDGIDGIGYYLPNGAGVGTWTLRQTAIASGPSAGSFNFEAAQPGYPVVGDWDGNGTDTFGTKTGATWSLTNDPAASGTHVVDPLYVFNFTVNAPQDLPVVWTSGVEAVEP